MNRAEQLGLMGPENYSYLSQSETYTVEGHDDIHEFKETLNGEDGCNWASHYGTECDFLFTLKAMSVIGLSSDEQQQILQVAAAILHLGNVSFTETKNCATVQDDQCEFLAEYIFLLLNRVFRNFNFDKC